MKQRPDSPDSRPQIPDALSSLPGAIAKGGSGWASYRGDAVLEGSPDLILRPKNQSDLVHILRTAHASQQPVTVAGGQSGLAGGAVAEDGVLLSTERLADPIRLEESSQGMTAVIPAGWFLGQAQEWLEGQGWFYPPDPTSRDEARVGGTVATNATGEDTLLYGPTRKWVKALRGVTACGEEFDLERTQPPPSEEKATAGYFMHGEPIDLLIGSEGTLGVISEVVVKVIPKPEGVFAGLAYFSDLLTALKFVVAVRQDSRVHPRALELFDRPALDLAAGNPEGIRWPDSAGAAICFKQELVHGPPDSALEPWLDLALDVSRDHPQGPALCDQMTVVVDSSGLKRLRSFRHHIPASLHELAAPFREAGGAKIGTDWWVPYEHIPDMLEKWRLTLMDSGLDAVMFGHIGNGHPHVNMLAKNAEETALARKLVLDMCRDAVALGGGVAGEHGLGKLKHQLLEIQYPGGLAKLQEIKSQWDPNWILGGGNLFPKKQVL